MKHYTKIFGALVALGIGGSAHAAAFEKVAPVGECSGENVVVPCEQSGWHVGAQYIFVQPTGDQLYSDLTSNSKWASGFRVEAGYHFGTGNDVTLNWTYFSKSSRRNVVPMTGLDAVIGELDELFDGLELNPIATEFPAGPISSSERVKSKFSAVNLEFGQMAHWGQHLSTRLHAGLQYASILRQRSHYNSSVTATQNFPAIGLDFATTVSSAANFEQKFSGIGPRVGIDAFYKLGDTNISLVGKAAIAVLASKSQVRNGYGRININEQMTSGNQAAVTIFDVNIDASIPNAKTKTLTPAFEAKLGAEYVYPLAAGELIFEGGYQWVAYPQSMLNPGVASLKASVYNADNLEEPLLQSPVETVGLGVPGKLNNFGYHGAYLGIRWKGDLA